jgi:hypothetical protein
LASAAAASIKAFSTCSTSTNNQQIKQTRFGDGQRPCRCERVVLVPARCDFSATSGRTCADIATAATAPSNKSFSH